MINKFWENYIGKNGIEVLKTAVSQSSSEASPIKEKCQVEELWFHFPAYSHTFETKNDKKNIYIKSIT